MRVRKSFLNSLKYQLSKWGLVNNEMGIDNAYTSMTVVSNDHPVLTISVSQGSLECKWSHDWAQWVELQNSPELKALLDKARKDLAGSSKGKGKSKTPTAMQ